MIRSFSSAISSAYTWTLLEDAQRSSIITALVAVAMVSGSLGYLAGL